MPVKPPHTTMLGVSAVNAIEGLLVPAGRPRRARRRRADRGHQAERPGEPRGALPPLQAARLRPGAAHRRPGRRGRGGPGGLHPHLPRAAEVPRRRGAVDLDLPAGGERGALAPDAARGRAAADAGQRRRPDRQGHRGSAGGGAGARATRSCARGSSGRWSSCRPATAPSSCSTTSRGSSTRRSPRSSSCHVGTSKSQLHKARARLREILAADGITAAALQNG